MSWRSTEAAQKMPMPVPGIAKRCQVFLPVMSWVLLPVMCQVFCLYILSSQLPNYMSWQSTEAAQKMPILSIAKRCQVFLPVMCQVFCLYILSSQLPDYMSWQSTESAQQMPMPVPGDAGHCQEVPSVFACDVWVFLPICPELQVATLYVPAVRWSCIEDADASAWWCRVFCLWCAEFFAYMSWAHSCHIMFQQSTEVSRQMPRPVPGGARYCQEMPSFFACHVPSFLDICPELTVATLYVLAVNWSFLVDAEVSARWCQALLRDPEMPFQMPDRMACVH